MARTPLDCAVFLETMVGDKDRFDSSSLLVIESKDGKMRKQHQQSATKEQRIRIGWLGNWGGHLPIEDGILTTCRAAIEEHLSSSIPYCSNSAVNNDKASSVVMVTDINEWNDNSILPQEGLFDFNKLWASYNSIRFASTYETYSRDFNIENLLDQRGILIKEELAWEIEQGQSVTDEDLKKAGEVYEEYKEWLERVYGFFDVLALPSAQVWPFPIHDRFPKVIENHTMDTYNRWMSICVPVSFGGLPCVTIPAGFGGKDNKLPIGVQLFGNRGDDLKLLSLACEYHRLIKGEQVKL